MQIVQLNVGGFDNNYTYLIVEEKDECVLIDPTGSKQVIDSYLKQHSLKPILQLITHNHPDHIENVSYFGGKKVPLKEFKDLQKESEFIISNIKIKVIFTPGHTKDGVCFLVENNLFTGDTLFVQGVGTTAYGGNEKQLSETLQKMFELPQEIIVWPGHNYGGKRSTLAKALANAHLRPSKETMEIIHKRVDEYNSKKEVGFEKPTN